MTDDAAQDKKTEDDSIAEADAQGSAASAASAEQAAEKPELKKDAEPAEAPKEETPTEASKEETPAEAPKEETPAEPAKPEAPESEADSAATADAKPKSALMSAVAMPMVALIALGVLLVGALAGLVFFAWQTHTDGNKLDDRAASTEAACGFMRVFAAYDDKTMPNFADQVRQRITDGDFKKQFEPAANELQDLLIKQHAKATLNFLHCGYETGDKDKATVLVNALQTASNDLHAQPLVLPIPAFVDLEKKDGKWLVSDFRAIYSNNDNSVFPGGGGDSQQGVQPSGQATPSAQPTQPAPSGQTSAPAAPKPTN
ncbi:hypothetical protein GPX89_22030 [Nocardia sp. ET3-3]|uniref:Mce-associated membrane protein n=1 Tax=Nocardia terrae TaxID=2675851 RepID=A0A7K1UZU5_9NOCA|nr:hypothetical protein [Nocardia terrae]MVU79910.1 hypothetical protein [Nocardia terrae]